MKNEQCQRLEVRGERKVKYGRWKVEDGSPKSKRRIMKQRLGDLAIKRVTSAIKRLSKQQLSKTNSTQSLNRLIAQSPMFHSPLSFIIRLFHSLFFQLHASLSSLLHPLFFAVSRRSYSLLPTSLVLIAVTLHFTLHTSHCLYAAVRTETKIVGDASELVTMPSAISISTISASATTPYGGVNIATNVFVTGNVGIGTTTPSGKLEVGSGKFIVKDDGNVGIGTNNPGAPFTVGNNAFQVNTSGNIIKLNNVSYSWPGSQGGANTVLTNASGDGTLTWVTGGGGGGSGGWTLDGTNIKLTDDSYIVGIGTAVPSAKLHIKTEDTTTVPLKIDYTVSGFSGFPGWTYRKPITITNSGGALTNYQSSVTVNTQELIGAGKMLSNGNDIRFTTSNGTTLIDYWIESGINTTSTRIWVEVPNINASGDTTIYLYYGKSDAPAATNFDNTFTKDYGETGLVGLWHLDDGTSPTADSSGNGHNGTLVNSPTWQGSDGGQWDGQAGTNFATGNRLSFNGTDQYVRLADTALGLTGNVTVTVVFWLYYNGNGGTAISWGWNEGINQSAWNIGPHLVTPAGHIGFWGRYADYDLGVLSLNAWNHIVVTHDSGNTMTAYINGTQTFNQTITTLNIQNTEIDISRNPSRGDFLNCLLDEVRIYNRVLSADEVKAYYERRKYASTAPIVGTPGTEEASASSMQTAVYVQNQSGNIGIGTTAPTSKLQVTGLPEYANNAAAIAGGLTVGAFYRTSTGVLMVVY